MIRRPALAALVAAAAGALFADVPKPEPMLSADQLRAAASREAISLPSPDEMLVAFEKAAKPDWTRSFRKLPAGSFTSRPQIALNIGVLLADAHVAVEAEDKQELKNIAREVKNLARSLGLEQELVGRSNTVSDFAEGAQWKGLSGEIEAVQNEITSAMGSRQDHDLVTLMLFGGWLRSLDAIGGQLAAKFSAKGAGVLRQTAIAEQFAQRLAAMPARRLELPLIAELRRGLAEIQAAFPRRDGPVPSVEEAVKLRTVTQALLTRIETQEK
jgi:hypothetical protein